MVRVNTVTGLKGIGGKDDNDYDTVMMMMTILMSMLRKIDDDGIVAFISGLALQSEAAVRDVQRVQLCTITPPPISLHVIIQYIFLLHLTITKSINLLIYPLHISIRWSDLSTLSFAGRGVQCQAHPHHYNEHSQDTSDRTH